MNANLDNSLCQHEKELLEKHLNHCAICAKEYAALKNTKMLLSALNKEQPKADFEKKIIDKIKSKSFSQNPLESFIAAARTSLIASVLIFGVIATFNFFMLSTYECSADNVEAINNYVLNENDFAKHNKISYAKIIEALLK
jgi:hypothetical protein